jgi:drug/metabolite transporter (DMT)-like permease
LGKLVLSTYGFEPVSYVFYYQLFLALFFLICTLVRRNGQHTVHVSKKYVYWIIGITILTLGYRYAHVSAMKLFSVGIVLAIHRSSTLITTIVGGRVYKEGGLGRKTLAALAIIGGILLLVL